MGSVTVPQRVNRKVQQHMKIINNPLTWYAIARDCEHERCRVDVGNWKVVAYKEKVVGGNEVAGDGGRGCLSAGSGGFRRWSSRCKT
jgi:hypothetical protein